MQKTIDRATCLACARCIEGIRLFRDFSDEERLHIMQTADHLLYSKGETVFSSEDPANRLIIVQQGKLKLCNYDWEGREHIYGIMTPASTLGEETLFSESSYGLRGEALTPVHLCVLSRTRLEELLRKDPDFAIRFIRSLGEKLSDSRELVSLLSIEDAKERLAHFLLSRQKLLQGEPIRLSRQTIASAINLSRETVSKKLNELAREGSILLDGYKNIRILHPEQLIATNSDR